MVFPVEHSYDCTTTLWLIRDSSFFITIINSLMEQEVSLKKTKMKQMTNVSIILPEDPFVVHWSWLFSIGLNDPWIRVTPPTSLFSETEVPRPSSLGSVKSDQKQDTRVQTLRNLLEARLEPEPETLVENRITCPCFPSGSGQLWRGGPCRLNRS